MIHPLLLEINTRCWLHSLSEANRRTVTLADVPDSEFERWRDMGLTHIWLMGVWPTGPRSRAFCLGESGLLARLRELVPGPGDEVLAGSPYAVAEYSVSPALGGAGGLKRFRERLNRQGMRLILDFIGNHMGLDHPWVSQKPELLVQSAAEVPGTFAQDSPAGRRWLAHGRDPYFPPWLDTVQIDYRRAETRTAMLDELRTVADQCDGVRCDMAMLQLNDIFNKTWAGFPAAPAPETEFWTDAIATIKSGQPDFLFLAEVYWDLESRLQSLGFDYTYDKCVYDLIVRRQPAELARRLHESSPGLLSASAHFLENHDEARVAALLSPAEHRAAALLIFGLPGMRMLYEGQTDGRRLRVPVQFARWPDEPTDAEIRAMYDRLFTALKNSAVGRGEWKMLQTGNADAVIVQWQNSPERFDVVAVNLAAAPGQLQMRPEIPGLAARTWDIRDALGGLSFPRFGGRFQEAGLVLDLPAHGAFLLQFSAKM
jgi:glycosidase